MVISYGKFFPQKFADPAARAYNKRLENEPRTIDAKLDENIEAAKELIEVFRTHVQYGNGRKQAQVLTGNLYAEDQARPKNVNLSGTIVDIYLEFFDYLNKLTQYIKEQDKTTINPRQRNRLRDKIQQLGTAYLAVFRTIFKHVTQDDHKQNILNRLDDPFKDLVTNKEDYLPIVSQS